MTDRQTRVLTEGVKNAAIDTGLYAIRDCMRPVQTWLAGISHGTYSASDNRIYVFMPQGWWGNLTFKRVTNYQIVKIAIALRGHELPILRSVTYVRVAHYCIPCLFVSPWKFSMDRLAFHVKQFRNKQITAKGIFMTLEVDIFAISKRILTSFPIIPNYRVLTAILEVVYMYFPIIFFIFYVLFGEKWKYPGLLP